MRHISIEGVGGRTRATEFGRGRTYLRRPGGRRVGAMAFDRGVSGEPVSGKPRRYAGQEDDPGEDPGRTARAGTRLSDWSHRTLASHRSDGFPAAAIQPPPHTQILVTPETTPALSGKSGQIPVNDPKQPRVKSLRLTATGVEVVRASDVVSETPARDAATILRENQEIEARYAKPIDLHPTRSRRKRDTWVALIAGNALILGVVAILPKNP